LFEATKSVSGFHAFLKSQNEDFDMQLPNFRAYFTAVGGLVVKYGEHYDSFEDVLEFCEITNLQLARTKCKSKRQIEFEKLKEENKKMMEEKQKEILKREIDDLMVEREQEAGQRPKRANVLSLPAQAAAAAAEEEVEFGDKVKDEEEAEGTVARRDSLGSLCGKTNSMSLKITDRQKIEMLMCEIRYYREALKCKGAIHNFKYEDALAEQKLKPEVAVPTGLTQPPWDDMESEEDED